MFTPHRIGPTLVDALPHVLAKNLQPGDLVAHRGRPGFDEAGGRPVIRIDPSEEEGRVRIIQPFLNPRYEGEESPLGAGADQPIAVLPPYWPMGETRELTLADVTAARDHIGTRAIEAPRT
ncbi:hypothetical protein ABZ027_31715 [Streptomyces sp. NPDC006332]|uniref:hypothetical protein n=1 Tax=Streptomyces sp. NPDC006332 TaxID=3155456 RepID=UPI0033B37B3A